ncbi:MAG: hypothetical protein WBO55_18325 [Rhizobiaceae bacterium]
MTITRISAVDGTLVEGAHRFEVEQAAQIAAFWEAATAANATLFNGRTVLGDSWKEEGGVFRFTCRAVNYATLLCWLQTPAKASAPASALHIYASPAIIGSDGRVIMGRMASHTANSGRVYFPSGSMELCDFPDGRADFQFNMRREVLEETGIDLNDSEVEDGYLLYRANGIAALTRNFRFSRTSGEILESINAFIRSGRSDDELSGVLSFGPGEIDPGMPGHMKSYMENFWG